MRMQRNFYEVLGVHKNATKKEIKEKYYDLARKFHPDRAVDKRVGDTLFAQINKAYTTLSNDAKRAKYDLDLEASSHLPIRPSNPAINNAPTPQQVTVQQVHTWFDQASRLQLAGNFDQAMELCAKTLQADPVNFPGLLLMGDLLAQTGKLQEAMNVYERAARIQPSNHLLREKMIRLTGLIERRKTNPGISRPSAPSSQSVQQKPAPKPEPKSLLDRLMNRK